MTESADPDAPLNGNLQQPVCVDTETMDWTASPSGTVWRKRVHRVGPAESGQVTSVVRYQPGASFPPHDHPEGEEILVLDGVFSDAAGFCRDVGDTLRSFSHSAVGIMFLYLTEMRPGAKPIAFTTVSRSA